jgi:hypothetical protein
MSTEYVNQVTLECLMNKENYQKYVTQKKKSVVNKKDLKFYRKRIMSLTKEILYPEEDTTHPKADPNITSIFQIYSKACIEYFKSLDTNDIIQEDYACLEAGTATAATTTEMSIENMKTQEEIDKQFLRSIKVTEPTTLDKFVRRNPAAEKPEPILPKQKDINLRDPVLKNKGIRKKKNISNKYEEPNKNNEESNKNNETQDKNNEEPTKKNKNHKNHKNHKKDKTPTDKNAPNETAAVQSES